MSGLIIPQVIVKSKDLGVLGKMFRKPQAVHYYLPEPTKRIQFLLRQSIVKPNSMIDQYNSNAQRWELTVISN